MDSHRSTPRMMVENKNKRFFQQEHTVSSQFDGKHNKSIPVIIKQANKKDEIKYFGKDEVDYLASQIGFDMELDKKKYWWLFKQMLLSPLPAGWEREYDYEGQTLFHHIEKGIQTVEHPLKNQFRTLFCNVLKKEKTLQREVTDQDIAIDPAYQQILKRERQKRQIEAKELLQKTKEYQGRIVLGSSRAYSMLSNTPNKNKAQNEYKFEKLMDENSNRSLDRFNHLKGLKSQQQRWLNSLNNRGINIINLDHNEREILIKEIEDECLNFYEERFGDILRDQEVMDSFLYKNLDILQVFEMGQSYGIDLISETYLLWIPQYVMCLPLPPNWEQIVSLETNKVVYIHLLKNIEIDFHPVEPFAQILLQKARKFYHAHPQEMKINNNNYEMYDSLMRSFKVNMNALRLQQSIQMQKRKNLIGSKILRNQSQNLQIQTYRQLPGLDQDDQQQTQQQDEKDDQIGDQKKDKQQEIYKMWEDSQKKDIDESYNYEKEDGQSPFKNGIFKQNYQVNDMELFVVAKQCSVNYENEINLLYLINETIVNIGEKLQHAWEFRFINQNKYYWFNKDKNLMSQTYPFLKEVVEKVDILRSKQRQLIESSRLSLFQKDASQDPQTQAKMNHIADKLNIQRKNMTSEILMTMINSNSVKINYSNKGNHYEEDGFDDRFDLRPLAEYMQNKMTKQELLEAIFYCSFNLDLFGKMSQNGDSMVELQELDKIKISKYDNDYLDYGDEVEELNEKQKNPRSLFKSHRNSVMETKQMVFQSSKNQQPIARQSEDLKNNVIFQKDKKSLLAAAERILQGKSSTNSLYQQQQQSSQPQSQMSSVSVSAINTGINPSVMNSPSANINDQDLNDRQSFDNQNVNVNQSDKEQILKKQQDSTQQITNNSKNANQENQKKTDIQNKLKGKLNVQSYLSTNHRTEKSAQRKSIQVRPALQFRHQKSNLTSDSEECQSPTTITILKHHTNERINKNLGRLQLVLKKQNLTLPKFYRILQESKNFKSTKKFMHLILTQELIKMLDITRNTKNAQDLAKVSKKEKQLEQDFSAYPELKGILQQINTNIEGDEQKKQRLAQIVTNCVYHQPSVENEYNHLYENDEEYFQRDSRKKIIEIAKLILETTSQESPVGTTKEENLNQLDVTSEFLEIKKDYLEKRSIQSQKDAITQRNARKSSILRQHQTPSSPSFKDQNQAFGNSLADLLFVNIDSTKKSKQREEKLKKRQNDLMLDLRQKIISIGDKILLQQTDSGSKIKQTPDDTLSEQVSNDSHKFNFGQEQIQPDNLQVGTGSVKKTSGNLNNLRYAYKIAQDTDQLQVEKRNSEKFQSGTQIKHFINVQVPKMFQLKRENELKGQEEQQAEREGVISLLKGAKSQMTKQQMIAHRQGHHLPALRINRLSIVKKTQSSTGTSPYTKQQLLELQQNESDDLRPKTSPQRKNLLEDEDSQHNSSEINPKIELELIDDLSPRIKNPILRPKGFNSTFDSPLNKKSIIKDASTSKLSNFQDNQTDLQIQNSKMIEEEDKESEISSVSSVDYFKYQDQIDEEQLIEENLKKNALIEAQKQVKVVKPVKAVIKFRPLSLSSSASQFRTAQYSSNSSRHPHDQNQFKRMLLASKEQQQRFKIIQNKEYGTDQNNQGSNGKNLDIAKVQDDLLLMLERKKGNFLHYCQQIGNPLDNPKNLKFLTIKKGIKPFNVLRIGQVLGIINPNKSRYETQLLWIAQQLLLQPLPDKSTLTPAQCEEQLATHQHPGYEYFRYLIHCQRRIFTKSLKRQTNEDQYKKDCSWLAFIQENEEIQGQDYQSQNLEEKSYFYNFYSHSKSILMPESLKIEEPQQLLFESIQTFEKVKGLNSYEQSTIIAPDIRSQAQMESTFDKGLLKSIKLILDKRVQTGTLRFDKLQQHNTMRSNMQMRFQSQSQSRTSVFKINIQGASVDQTTTQTSRLPPVLLQTSQSQPQINSKKSRSSFNSVSKQWIPHQSLNKVESTNTLVQSALKKFSFNNLVDLKQVGIPKLLATRKSTLSNIDVVLQSQTPYKNVQNKMMTHRASDTQLRSLQSMELQRGFTLAKMITEKQWPEEQS